MSKLIVDRGTKPETVFIELVVALWLTIKGVNITVQRAAQAAEW
jgi:hypothetical protein